MAKPKSKRGRKKRDGKPKRKYTAPAKPKGLKPISTAYSPRAGKKVPYYYVGYNPIAKKEYVLGNTLMKPCKSKKDCTRKRMLARKRNMKRRKAIKG